MAKVYERTENGTTAHVSIREAMAEVNGAMMAGKRHVRTMSSGRTQHSIEYKDGRQVRMTLVDAPAPEAQETDSKGRRIVAVKGKRYIVGAVVPARPKVDGVPTWVPEAYVAYWSERNGETFGATRFASASGKPGTVGRAIWDAVK
ncbi:hypothetical protein [Streptomyces xantholiticus]|uniref:hypothetical protein n=1 Tax=Streptomyces xantholiticus TaxID=68285 RepID=UPI001673C9F6|nr:hypothetical protein [Streptomyces xantholiticus]